MARDYNISCRHCAWYENNDLSYSSSGHCHYNPPTTGVSSFGQGGVYTVWPEVMDTDWCGKFERPEKLEPDTDK